MDVDPRWYETFFARDYLDVVRAQDPALAATMVDFVVEKLELQPGARILDLACGHGRHSIEFAKRGFVVTGLDLSEPSLALARERADEAGVDVEWVRSDMREPPPGPFDAVVNLFQAFGYFEDEVEDRRVLQAVAHVLSPGGLLLMDVVHPPGLFGRYRGRWWEHLDEGLLLQEHEYDLLRGRNTARWTLVRQDGTRGTLEHTVRLYALHELVPMLESAGLVFDTAWGGWDGSELTRESWRLILRARKP